jgi:uracil-DNA glycosylase family 4
MNRPVPDYGPYDAPLLVVGEAGGKHEGAKGRPFVGPTGARVRAMVAEAGLDPERDVRWANVIPMEMSTLPKTVGAMQGVVRRWWSAIDATLAMGQHRGVIVYGRAAAFRLLGLTGILDAHGGVYHVEVGGRRVPCVVSVHPAAVMRTKIEAGWELVTKATQRACRYATGVATFDAQRQLPGWKWCYSGAEIIALWHEAVVRGAPIAIDTEYDRETKRPFIIGMTCDGESVLTVAPTEETVLALRQVMNDANVVKLIHHIPADVTSLSTLGVDVRPPVVNTLTMYATVWPDLPVGLARCALHLFDHWHDWKDMSHGDPQYNAIDVVATWRLYHELLPRMSEFDLWDVWRREVRHVDVLCLAMEARGLMVDGDAQRRAVVANDIEAEKLRAEVNAHVEVIFAKRIGPVAERLAEVIGELDKMTPLLPRLVRDREPAMDARVKELRKLRDQYRGKIERWSKGFDLGNNEHLRWLLYDEDAFKLPVQRKDGRPTANADAIAKLRGLKRVQESPAMARVLTGVKEYQHLKKMKSTFLLWDVAGDRASGAVDGGGCAHPEYRSFGAGTGRLAGGPDTDLGDRKVNPYAYNALNIPEETRHIYIPHREGFEVSLVTVASEVVDDAEDVDEGDVSGV